MAVTAAMTVSNATPTLGQKVSVTCTITNTGGSDISVLAIRPVTTPTGQLNHHVAVSNGRPPLLPNQPVTVPASNGTLALSWDVAFHAPTSGYGLAEPASFVYDVGATITTTGNVITTATTTTVTVASPAHT